MTIVETARKGIVPPFLRRVAGREQVAPDDLLRGIAEGTIVVPRNRHRKLTDPRGIGKGLSVKVNANIGMSPMRADPRAELRKARAAVAAGADALMDLSIGGDLARLRGRILKRSSLPVGTVPIYQAAIRAGKEKGRITAMTAEDMLRAIEDQAREGVDFMTIHAGVNSSILGTLKKSPRLLGVVSRGGAFLLEWMIVNGKENPLYERFDDVLAIARRHEVTLSLGDGLRPGCLADATDPSQIRELLTLGELAARSREAGVQVMIEGPGHVPLDQIEANVKLEKEICSGAPFYVLGPLVTDVAAGYDHIACAIGGAWAAYAGADFLCYVTPSEHLSLPGEEEVREGVIASRIAAHAADLARGRKGARDWDDEMSRLRRKRDWKGQIALAIDPDRARRYRGPAPKGEDYCSMCSEFCAIKILEGYLGKG
jgi:phosphomethylpyrimidine synthase